MQPLYLRYQTLGTATIAVNLLSFMIPQDKVAAIICAWVLYAVLFGALNARRSYVYAVGWPTLMLAATTLLHPPFAGLLLGAWIIVVVLGGVILLAARVPSAADVARDKRPSMESEAVSVAVPPSGPAGGDTLSRLGF